mmetsp:Transcript_41175/g.122154  ORF Transcript_41175/g.122154 Transcript_41175/m.122154 type:complete len:229 (-) Transcript_41175:944-1630(-)
MGPQERDEPPLIEGHAERRDLAEVLRVEVRDGLRLDILDDDRHHVVDRVLLTAVALRDERLAPGLRLTAAMLRELHPLVHVGLHVEERHDALQLGEDRLDIEAQHVDAGAGDANLHEDVGVRDEHAHGQAPLQNRRSLEQGVAHHDREGEPGHGVVVVLQDLQQVDVGLPEVLDFFLEVVRSGGSLRVVRDDVVEVDRLGEIVDDIDLPLVLVLQVIFGELPPHAHEA